MQFNDVATKQGLVQDAWYILFADSGDHSADFPLADMARFANVWYMKAQSKILQADSRWEWDDANKTDLPIANIDIVNGQYDYGVAGLTFLKISRIDAKDSGGNGVAMVPFNTKVLRGVALNEFMKGGGIPQYYNPRGSSFFCYPTPNYSVTKGFRVFYQRDADLFTAADTTKQPGFATMFHRIISLGMAYEYALVNGLDKVRQMVDLELYGDARKQKVGLFDELQTFYMSRNTDQKQSMSLSRTDYGESALGSAEGARFGTRYDNPKGF